LREGGECWKSPRRRLPAGDQAFAHQKLPGLEVSEKMAGPNRADGFSDIRAVIPPFPFGLAVLKTNVKPDCGPI